MTINRQNTTNRTKHAVQLSVTTTSTTLLAEIGSCKESQPSGQAAGGPRRSLAQPRAVHALVVRGSHLLRGLRGFRVGGVCVCVCFLFHDLGCMIGCIELRHLVLERFFLIMVNL